MVWSMDSQIAKLNEGNKQIARTEENLARMEKLAAETTSQLDAATKAKDELAREMARVEKDGHALNDSIRGHVDRLTVEKKEFEIFDQRLRVLQASVGEAEGRMESLAAKDKNVAQLEPARRYPGEACIRNCSRRATSSTRNRRALESLHTRLDQVDRALEAHQFAARALNQSRARPRDAPEGNHRLPRVVRRGGAAARQARLRSRGARGFIERVTRSAPRAPEIEAKMDAIQAKFGLIEEGTQKATRVGELASELDGQLNRVTARLQFVEQVEARINGLNGVLADVERKLGDQLARRAEVDTIKTQIDTVGALIGDAQNKLEGVNALQHKLLPMTAQLSMLRSEIEKAFTRLKSVQREEGSSPSRRAASTSLLESTRQISGEVTERQRQVQSMSEELTRSASVKEELLGELARIQARQRDTVAHIDASTISSSASRRCSSSSSSGVCSSRSPRRRSRAFETRSPSSSS